MLCATFRYTSQKSTKYTVYAVLRFKSYAMEKCIDCGNVHLLVIPKI
jgi:hypothetical protein